MKRFGITEKVKELVGACGFEPQTPTVSSDALPGSFIPSLDIERDRSPQR